MAVTGNLIAASLSALNSNCFMTAGPIGNDYIQFVPPASGLAGLTLKNASGFIGLNNTNPSYQLDIVGAARMQQTLIGLGAAGNLAGSSPNGLIMSSTVSGTLSAPHISVYANTSYPIYQQLNWSADNISLSFDSYYADTWRRSGTAAPFQMYKNGGVLYWGYASAGTVTQPISWAPGLLLNSTGQVGIGTFNPSYLLDVNGSGRFLGSLTTGPVFSSSLTCGSFYGTLGSLSTLTAGSFSGNFSSLTSLYASTISFGSMSGGACSVTSLQSGTFTSIASGGAAANLTGPLTILNGTIDAARFISALDNSMSASSSRYLAFGQSNSYGNEAELMYTFSGSNNSNNALGLGFYSKNNVLYLTFGGFVGINNSSPAFGLDVTGTGHISGSLTFDNGLVSNAAVGTVPRQTSGLYVWTDRSFGMELQASNANGGNGVQAPNNWATTFVTRSADGCFVFKKTTAPYSNSDIGTPLMVISNAGLVGINTTSPSFALDVSGSGRITGSLSASTLTFGSLGGTLGNISTLSSSTFTSTFSSISNFSFAATCSAGSINSTFGSIATLYASTFTYAVAGGSQAVSTLTAGSLSGTLGSISTFSSASLTSNFGSISTLYASTFSYGVGAGGGFPNTTSFYAATITTGSFAGTYCSVSSIAYTSTLTTAIITVSSWISPTLTNSWTRNNTSFTPPGYMLDPMGFVHLRGLISGGSGVIFYLPTGYRPAYNIIAACVTNNHVFGDVQIGSSDGSVTPVTFNSTWFCLDTVTFSIYS